MRCSHVQTFRVLNNSQSSCHCTARDGEHHHRHHQQHQQQQQQPTESIRRRRFFHSRAPSRRHEDVAFDLEPARRQTSVLLLSVAGPSHTGQESFDCGLGGRFGEPERNSKAKRCSVEKSQGEERGRRRKPRKKKNMAAPAAAAPLELSFVNWPSRADWSSSAARTIAVG